MPFVEYLASTPEFSALFALATVVCFVCLVVGMIMGRAGEEISFIFGVASPIRRLISRCSGALGGMLVGTAAGGILGNLYGLGPDHVLVGFSSFIGLTIGTFLGSLSRTTQPEDSPEDRALDRFRWVVWRYTSLELENAVSVVSAAIFGAVCGLVIELVFPVMAGGLRRALQIGLGGLVGAILGATSGSITKEESRITRVVIGQAVGIIGGTCFGLFLVSIGKSYSFVATGIMLGLIGGLCFGVIGGDRIRDRTVD